MLNRDQMAYEILLKILDSTDYVDTLAVRHAFELTDEYLERANKNLERPDIIGDGWIYIKDQKPKEGQSVAIYFGLINEDAKMVSYMTWTDQEYAFKGNIQYIAWQPLPQAPK